MGEFNNLTHSPKKTRQLPVGGPTVCVMGVDWNSELADQLDWHWREALRPRFDGLTDDEYRWEPVPGMWSIRPRGTSTAAMSLGGGAFTMDYDREADPAPATTIAWRLSHLLTGVFGMRVGVALRRAARRLRQLRLPRDRGGRARPA